MGAPQASNKRGRNRHDAGISDDGCTGAAQMSISERPDRSKGVAAAMLVLLGMFLYMRAGSSVQSSTASRVMYTAQGSDMLQHTETVVMAGNIAVQPSGVEDQESESEPETQIADVSAYLCRKRQVHYGALENPGPQSRLKREERTSCSHELRPEDIVVGIFTSRATESKAENVIKTWGRHVTVELLGSVESSKHDVLITGEPKDDYLSTLGKGMLGLKRMAEGKHKDKKWFVIHGDDVFLQADNLVTALSAFDPDEVWAFGQIGLDPKPFRLFGGAPIITSRAATTQLAPKLQAATDRYRNSGGPLRLHDLAFSDLLISNKVWAVDIKGLYSNPPAYFICAEWGHKDAPEGLPTFPLAFHYVQGPYLHHISFLLDDFRVCGDLPASRMENAMSPNASLPGAALALASEQESSRVLDVAVGVLPSTIEFGSREDQIRNSWGQYMAGVAMISGDEKRPLKMLTEQFPGRSWYMLVTADTYVVPENLVGLLRGWARSRPRLLLSSEPNEAAGPILVNGVMAYNLTDLDVKALRAGAGEEPTRLRPELLSSAYASEPSPGLCAATIRFNHDWSMVAQLQVDREKKSQFYLTDYAVAFRRAWRRMELYEEVPPPWYSTAHIPVHCG